MYAAKMVVVMATNSSAQLARRGLESEHLFRLIVESVRDYAIFMLDPSGCVATWNVGAERINQYRAEEILGRHFSTFYPPEVAATGMCERELEAAARDGRFEDEGWRVRKDGTKIWANVIISAVRDPDGTLIGFSKVTRDLTERRRNEERMRLLVESVHDHAMFMVDRDGLVVTWNVGAERLFGYRPEDFCGQHLSRIYPEADEDLCQRQMVIAEAEGRYADEGWLVRSGGARFWASVVLTAVREDDALVGYAVVIRDLTERKRAEDERAAREVAERANRAKDEFLAILGHELRNPLAPIVTALQLMKLRGDARSSREQEVIERQVKHVMRLVDDLLDVSRVARGLVRLQRRHVGLDHIVAAAVEVMSPMLEQRRHHLDVSLPPEPITLDVDEGRMIQVLSNLLSNAAKYTEPGGHISLAVRKTDEAHVEIQVADDGVGIDPALLPRVFDLFIQGHQGAERSSGGLGLGLSLVRSLVALHGGTVEALSPGPGKGATFVLHLPVATRISRSRERAMTEEPELSGATHPRRVLVVDDNEDARALLGEALAAVGHDVQLAADPVEALDVVTRFTPEVAILDIGLPVMDGYELAVRLRELLGANTPRLLALTGYGQDQDLERSRNAGFELHLVKPIDLMNLLALIDQPD